MNNKLKFFIKPIYFKLRAAYFSGSNYNCPVCGSNSYKFLKAGTQIRSNAKCPACSSLERDRALDIFLKKSKLINKEKIKLLHVAPEYCFFIHFKINKQIEYYPIDKFDDGYYYAPPTQNMDITNLEFEDDYFDLIICNHVLEHVADDLKAMKELARVLKQNGNAILNIPIDINRKKTYEDFSITDAKERLKHFGQEDHVRVYGMDYTERLESVGFQTNVISIKEYFSNEEINNYALLEDDIIIHSTLQ